MPNNSFVLFKQAVSDLNKIDDILREDLAAIILETLNHGWKEGFLSLPNFVSQLGKEYDESISSGTAMLISPAWQWLLSEGFLAPTPDQNGNSCGTVFITKLGVQQNSKELVEHYIQSKILQTQYLHPRLKEIASPLFIRGKYEIAIFAAFKEIEIATRDASKITDKDGDKLMRKAFDIKSGPLTDKAQRESEQYAIAHLFAGAFGYFRNPVSHRETDLNDPVEAAEIIMFASYLLRTIDKRKANKEAETWAVQESLTQR